MRNRYKIKKGDTVQVIQGKETGKRGKVLRVLSDEGRVVVERVNFIKRHVRPSQKNPAGGVIEREGSRRHLQRAVGLPRLRTAGSGWCAYRR